MDPNPNPQRQLTPYDDTPPAGQNWARRNPGHEPIAPLTDDEKVVMIQRTYGLINVKATRNAGSFGSIVTGNHPETGQFYAIKVILCGYDHPDYIELVHERRVRREAHILNQLRGQPNIVEFFALEFSPERHAMIQTEHLGQTLRKITPRHRFNEANVIRLATQLNGALIYMQDRHIVHHDIKLANIMLARYLNPRMDPVDINRFLSVSTFKFIDFGLAKIYQHANPVERNHRDSTLKYMCYEKLYDRRYPTYDANLSDGYSLGVCLYQAYTGKAVIDAYRQEPYMQRDAPDWRRLARVTLPYKPTEPHCIERIISGLLESQYNRDRAHDTQNHLDQMRQ